MNVPFSVIIPSRTLSNLGPCVAAVQVNEPDLPLRQIVVVDDDETGKVTHFCEFNGLTRVEGRKPFIFSRAINSGILTALEMKVDLEGFILLNDDALLQTERGFTLLHVATVRDLSLGIVASACSNVGNPNQWPRGTERVRYDPRMVCFVSVYIPRSTVEAIGLLDEEFIGYGFEDDSYCLRLRRAGFSIGIHDGCVTDHGSLVSTFRGDPRTPASLEQNHAIYRAKWGEDNRGNK
jgi:GT2 family glycosyltransferase